MITYIFQITEFDIERSTTLKLSDLGKWCFLNRGCYEGFCDSKEKLQERLGE
jgi:hypothetical protein